MKKLWSTLRNYTHNVYHVSLVVPLVFHLYHIYHLLTNSQRLLLSEDLGDIEEQFENGKKLLINSGKYQKNDPEVDAPLYSRVLSEQFKLLKNKIWSNPKYQYLLDYNLKDIIYYKNSAWCKFKIEKILHIKAL